MARHHLDSSTVRWVDYDDATATMLIEFTSGILYQYFLVPRSVVDQLLAAPSAGAFFNERIRGVYRFIKV